MEADVVIRSVERIRTRSGKVRYVVRADDGREFSTFRERIGEEAEGYQGQRVRIEYHEEERAGFHNVYLDASNPRLAGTRLIPTLRRLPGARRSRRRHG
jgi:hypothetical protein